jgi:flagellar secretion chaperone FliS
MANHGYGSYFEDKILSANPMELVSLLYKGAEEAVTQARAQLAAQDITGRSGSISKAHEILCELLNSLNFEAGGELGQNLAHLYLYMQRRLLQAHIEQSDEPLAECQELLKTVREGWEEASQKLAAQAYSEDLRRFGEGVNGESKAEPAVSMPAPMAYERSEGYMPLSLTA